MIISALKSSNVFRAAVEQILPIILVEFESVGIVVGTIFDVLLDYFRFLKIIIKP